MSLSIIVQLGKFIHITDQSTLSPLMFNVAVPAASITGLFIVTVVEGDITSSTTSYTESLPNCIQSPALKVFSPDVKLAPAGTVDSVTVLPVVHVAPKPDKVSLSPR